VNPPEEAVAAELSNKLLEFDKSRRALPGISTANARSSLVRQFVDSIRRIRYVTTIIDRDISQLRADASSDLFDPLKAAVLHKQVGEIDEACWLVFLSVHFGKAAGSGWRLVRDVYGALGQGPAWTWKRTIADRFGFRTWLNKNLTTLRGSDGVKRRFGNHRKYQSLDAMKPSGTGAAVKSYITWISPPRSHGAFFDSIVDAAGGDPKVSFESLYKSMAQVSSFGRMARFDYLTMVGKIGLILIEPGSPYLRGATGPMNGARLLFSNKATAGRRVEEIDAWLIELGGFLGVGMQVMEDGICNWQKSPNTYRPFRG
jgi:Alpha-glutamyl/putrescinyl thymine pyrophosphorylase clade 3